MQWAALVAALAVIFTAGQAVYNWGWEERDRALAAEMAARNRRLFELQTKLQEERRDADRVREDAVANTIEAMHNYYANLEKAKASPLPLPSVTTAEAKCPEPAPHVSVPQAKGIPQNIIDRLNRIERGK
jgi:cob(I)alamin adenosyltransferase